MISKWETERERLLKFMKIPPKKKLEWLRKMNETIARTGSLKRFRLIRKKLREL